MDTSDKIHDIWSIQKIIKLRSDYSHHRQYHRWEEFIDLFTEDATVIFPFTTLEGKEEIRDFVMNVWTEEFDTMFGVHNATMPSIEVSGDEAAGEWFMNDFYSVTGGSEGWAMGAYHDRYRLVDDEWKFSKVEAEVLYDTARSGRFFPDGYAIDPRVGSY
jgi:hypothetical protein